MPEMYWNKFVFSKQMLWQNWLYFIWYLRCKAPRRLKGTDCCWHLGLGSRCQRYAFSDSSYLVKIRRWPMGNWQEVQSGPERCDGHCHLPLPWSRHARLSLWSRRQGAGIWALCGRGSRTWSSSEVGIFLCVSFLKRAKMLSIKLPILRSARNTLMGMKCKKVRSRDRTKSQKNIQSTILLM